MSQGAENQPLDHRDLTQMVPSQRGLSSNNQTPCVTSPLEYHWQLISPLTVKKMLSVRKLLHEMTSNLK